MDLSKTITKTENFLLENRLPNNLWTDFKFNHHGESIDWVSSYVGLSLISTSKEKLIDTAASIAKLQQDSGGFSYNHKVCADADSTAIAIKFLDYFGHHKAVEKAKDFLKLHQLPDGSYSTYLPNLLRKHKRMPSEVSIEGWCSGTPEITATALQVIPNNLKAINYLKNSQQKDGSWRSYWWNNDIYATAFATKVLQGKEIEKAQRWLARTSSDIPFYMALSVQALISNKKHRREVESRVEQLVKAQQRDGSWKAKPILRLPWPDNSKPWINPKRKKEDLEDQNRFFTTATCLGALNDARMRWFF